MQLSCNKFRVFWVEICSFLVTMALILCRSMKIVYHTDGCFIAGTALSIKIQPSKCVVFNLQSRDDCSSEQTGETSRTVVETMFISVCVSTVYDLGLSFLPL